MLRDLSLEELEDRVKQEKVTAFLFTADWCPDCQFLYPVLFDIEEDFSEVDFVPVDRDHHMDLAKAWNIFGIPSLVVTQNGKEVGRLVNKQRKTKEEILSFLDSVVRK